MFTYTKTIKVKHLTQLVQIQIINGYSTVSSGGESIQRVPPESLQDAIDTIESHVIDELEEKCARDIAAIKIVSSNFYAPEGVQTAS